MDSHLIQRAHRIADKHVFEELRSKASIDRAIAETKTIIEVLKDVERKLKSFNHELASSIVSSETFQYEEIAKQLKELKDYYIDDDLTLSTEEETGDGDYLDTNPTYGQDDESYDLDSYFDGLCDNWDGRLG